MEECLLFQPFLSHSLSQTGDSEWSSAAAGWQHLPPWAGAGGAGGQWHCLPPSTLLWVPSLQGGQRQNMHVASHGCWEFSFFLVWVPCILLDTHCLMWLLWYLCAHGYTTVTVEIIDVFKSHRNINFTTRGSVHNSYKGKNNHKIIKHNTY